jgi:hypothetical protein
MIATIQQAPTTHNAIAREFGSLCMRAPSGRGGKETAPTDAIAPDRSHQPSRRLSGDSIPINVQRFYSALPTSQDNPVVAARYAQQRKLMPGLILTLTCGFTASSALGEVPVVGCVLAAQARRPLVRRVNETITAPYSRGGGLAAVTVGSTMEDGA